jgi:hypothetical protein
MIKLTNLLEGKILLQSTDKKSELPSGYPEFTVYSRGSYQNEPIIQFIPKKSKDLDTIDTLGSTKRNDISKQLVKIAEKRTKLKFKPFPNYEGAGYGIILDMDFIVKQLNK